MTALWVLHTHATGAAESTPYLAVNSAEKRSGKTRLFEVLDHLVARPWFAGRITSAALARKIEQEQPTLLLDESDAAFKGDREYAETLRGILNAGYRRGGKVTVCVGQGANLSYRDFTVFGPKAIAGLGRLPDTVSDRSIPIRLKRRKRSEKIERLRLRKVAPEAEELRQRAEAWAQAHLRDLAGAQPEIPDELDDRAQDIVEPLLAIAGAAGGEWPKRARRAAKTLLAAEEREDADSLGVRLLRDLRDAFEEEGADALRTSEVLTALNTREEAPWSKIRNGEALDASRLARYLRPYGIKPDQFKHEGEKARGYRRPDFEDAWARYLV